MDLAKKVHLGDLNYEQGAYVQQIEVKGNFLCGVKGQVHLLDVHGDMKVGALSFVSAHVHRNFYGGLNTALLQCDIQGRVSQPVLKGDILKIRECTLGSLNISMPENVRAERLSLCSLNYSVVVSQDETSFSWARRLVRWFDRGDAAMYALLNRCLGRDVKNDPEAQVIVLYDTVIKGNVSFEGAKGIVVLKGASKVEGVVRGGLIQSEEMLSDKLKKYIWNDEHVRQFHS